MSKKPDDLQTVITKAIYEWALDQPINTDGRFCYHYPLHTGLGVNEPEHWEVVKNGPARRKGIVANIRHSSVGHVASVFAPKTKTGQMGQPIVYVEPGVEVVVLEAKEKYLDE